LCEIGRVQSAGGDFNNKKNGKKKEKEAIWGEKKRPKRERGKEGVHMQATARPLTTRGNGLPWGGNEIQPKEHFESEGEGIKGVYRGKKKKNQYLRQQT